MGNGQNCLFVPTVIYFGHLGIRSSYYKYLNFHQQKFQSLKLMFNYRFYKTHCV